MEDLKEKIFEVDMRDIIGKARVNSQLQPTQDIALSHMSVLRFT